VDGNRRVTVLHDLENDGPRPAVGDVATALATAGLAVAVLEVRDDLDALAEGLRRHRPDLVFNLVERFAGNSRLAPDVAAALDLLAVPYTGAGPPGLYLAVDAALSRRLLSSYGVLAETSSLPTSTYAVLGNDRVTIMPDGEELVPLVQATGAALRLRDYALIEASDVFEPVLVRAVPNPSLGRDEPFAAAAARAGISYDDLILRIANEAWERHHAVAGVAKTA
jgi:D-alanine-D-alanine ligase-like ATP-grasp enzyme